MSRLPIGCDIFLNHAAFSDGVPGKMHRPATHLPSSDDIRFAEYLVIICRPILSLAALCILLLFPIRSGNAQDNRSPSVGAPGTISQLVLPGSELIAKPITDDRTPIVVRIVETYPHGEQFRYDLAFHGLEPGDYDLADYLQRKDESPTDDLPPIPVQIRSLLPPGQIEPNQLDVGLITSIGGYRILAVLAVLAWIAIFIAIFFVGRKKKPLAEPAMARPQTLGELLRPRLEKAMAGNLPTSQLAELERMLIAMWRRQLGLEKLTTSAAVAAIRQDPTAGPLMQQLESWLHDKPSQQACDQLDLSQLLAPYNSLSIELLNDGERELVRQ